MVGYSYGYVVYQRRVTMIRKRDPGYFGKRWILFLRREATLMHELPCGARQIKSWAR